MSSLILASATGCSSEVDPDFSRMPVVFIHGHGMSPNDWTQMIDHLSATGYPRDYLRAVDIQPNVMGNIDAAELVIAPAVEEIIKNARFAALKAGYTGALPERVDLVSHSMGAVSSRWYAARLVPERVRVWVSLGGANHGSSVLCEYHDDGAVDLCPAFAASKEMSLVQVTLNGTPERPIDETPWGLGSDADAVLSIAADAKRNIAYFTIRIDPDSWIHPADSAVLSGAGSDQGITDTLYFKQTTPGNLLLLTNTHHDDLPQDEEVIAVVDLLLRQEYAGK